MKKFLLLLVVTMMTLVSANAQTSLVATLSHDGNVTTFYSANALKDAYAAAVDGDIITLSSGNFTSPGYIEKNVTIRGAGMMLDMESTTISDYCYIKAPKSEEGHSVTLEGLLFLNDLQFKEAHNASIIKCRIKQLYGQQNDVVARIIHTVIEDEAYLNMGDFIIISSFIKGHVLTSARTITNCIIQMPLGGYINNINLNGRINSCILLGSNEYDYIDTPGSQINNCVYVGPSNKFFTDDKDIIGIDNIISHTDTSIFKEGTTIYELTDENKAAWLGSDGKEVGMHGGSLPFDPTPSNPQVTKFNVAPKTTADGKLSVDIEVKAN